MLIDTHAHIQFQAYKDDRDAVVARCRERGMILNLVGTQKDTSRLAVELAEQYDWMYASIATHPIHLHPTHVDEEETHFMSREESFDWDHYGELAKSKKVIGVGETGLDLYHIPKDKTVEEVLAKQTQVFLDHVEFARLHDLPLVIHCRDGSPALTTGAHDSMIKILKSLKREIRGTVHCYTSDWAHAEAYLALGLYLGFTGVVTFPPKKLDPTPQLDLLEVVKRVPLDRVVVETDSPYLAPQAYRGQRAEPWMVEEVVKKFAEVRGTSYEEMTGRIEANTRRLFSKIR